MKQIRVDDLPKLSNVEGRYLNFKYEGELKVGDRVILYNRFRSVGGKVSQASVGGEFVLDTSP